MLLHVLSSTGHKVAVKAQWLNSTIEVGTESDEVTNGDGVLKKIGVKCKQNEP